MLKKIIFLCFICFCGMSYVQPTESNPVAEEDELLSLLDQLAKTDDNEKPLLIEENEGFWNELMKNMALFYELPFNLKVRLLQDLMIAKAAAIKNHAKEHKVAYAIGGGATLIISTLLGCQLCAYIRLRCSGD